MGTLKKQKVNFWNPYYEKTMNPIKIRQKNEFQDLLQDCVKKLFFFSRNNEIKIPQRAQEFFCHLSYFFFWNPYYQKTINPKKKSVKNEFLDLLPNYVYISVLNVTKHFHIMVILQD